MRFATRLLLVQLVTVAAVLAVCATAFGWLGVRQLRAESEASALNIARTVAEDPEVRALVAEFSADPGIPDAAALRGGDLARLAADVAGRTDALFVVITDDHGIRLAHPNAELLGQVVSTPFEEVLRGNEVVDWETGTLGESARAKVPVYPPGGPAAAVGEVSVGFERATVFDDLPALLTSIVVAVAAALGLATLATLLLRRRFERLTLGLQPEELVALVQNQAAVLDGVDDGVIALDADGIVRVCNSAAERMLRLDDPVGRPLDRLDLPADVVEGLRSGAADGVVVGDRVLYLDSRPVSHGTRPLGDVVVVRDRTDLEALASRLETVGAMTEALRVQRHEFANRLHVAAGLLDARRVPDAQAFLADLLERGSVDFAVAGIERVPDPLLQSLLGAKSIAAGERGVALRVSDDTLVMGTLAAVEDVAAILGNLLDNAVVAAVAGEPPAWVEVALLGDADELVITVTDSGRGIPPSLDPFQRAPDRAGEADDDVARVHGRGFGLPLSRELARRVGGEVWLIDRGGEGRGAVFGARIPGALRQDGTGQTP